MTRTGKGRRWFIWIVCLLCVCTPLSSQAQTKPTKTVDYLPRNEVLDRIATPTGYSRTLQEISCTAADELTFKINRCNQCIQLKNTCPDCCLSADLSAPKCTSSEDASLYTCLSNSRSCEVPAMFTTCDAVSACPTASVATDCESTDIPNCLELGCPSGRPALPSPAVCVQDTLVPSKWTCSVRDDTVGPQGGCVPAPGTVDDCGLLTYAYTVTPSTVCPSELGVSLCYEYMPTPALSTCINDCVSFARAKERFDKNVYCCREDVCCAELGCTTGTVGFTQYCTSSSCTSRLEWLECQPATLNPELCCNSLTADTCSQWTQELYECASGGSTGACRGCYAEIDPAFRYQFVARSSEKIVVLWSVEAHPAYTPTTSEAPNTFFYTMVQVIQEDTGSVVHQSIAHERSFSGAFSIFSATSVDDPNTFFAGKRYSVRLFYFIPSLPDYTLTSQVTSMELTLLRVKE